MKKLILVLLLSFNCFALEMHEQYIDPKKKSFNGVIEDIGQNSWRFTTHTNESRNGCIKSFCRKVGVQADDPSWVRDRITKYNFDFTIEKYPETAPEWVIVFQNWMRIDPEDENGNHPITTLKLKLVAGKIMLQQYENSWQFDRSYFDLDDYYDTHHDHGYETLKGETELQVSSTYKIELIIAHGHLPSVGHVTLKVDGKIVSDSVYQTKSFTELGMVYFGHYWSKEADSLDYQLVTKIENLTYKITY